MADLRLMVDRFQTGGLSMVDLSKMDGLSMVGLSKMDGLSTVDRLMADLLKMAGLFLRMATGAPLT